MDIQNKQKEKVGTMSIGLKVKTHRFDPHKNRGEQGNKMMYIQDDSDSISLENEEEEYEEELEEEELEHYDRESLLEDQIRHMHLMAQEKEESCPEEEEESDDDPVPDDEDKIETIKPSVRDPKYRSEYQLKGKI
jgi:hypothetical protein